MASTSLSAGQFVYTALSKEVFTSYFILSADGGPALWYAPRYHFESYASYGNSSLPSYPESTLIFTATVTQKANSGELTADWTLKGTVSRVDRTDESRTTITIDDSGTATQTINKSTYTTESVLTSAAGGLETSTDLGAMGARMDDYGNLYFSLYSSNINFSIPGYDALSDISAYTTAGIPGANDPQNITGTSGSDTLSGGAKDDTISGGGGDDSISAGAGNDTVYGGSGDDTIDGGEGADYMEGGAGADTYYVDDKKDQVVETSNDPDSGAGLVLDADIGSIIDTVISSVTYTLTNYIENLTLAESTAKLAGTGNTLDNEIIGNGGANKLTGGTGNDTLDGGAGIDQLLGGTGSDTFRFSNLATGGADTIKDFADEDLLYFDTSIFTRLVGTDSGNLMQGSAAADPDDYLIYNKGKLYYDADADGSGAATLIVGLKGADVKTFTIEDCVFG